MRFCKKKKFEYTCSLFYNRSIMFKQYKIVLIRNPVLTPVIVFVKNGG